VALRIDKHDDVVDHDDVELRQADYFEHESSPDKKGPGCDPRPFRRYPGVSELDPEAELHRERRVGDVRVGARLPERGAVDVGRVLAVVLPVEQVEHLEDAVDRPAAAEADALLESHVHTVDRLPDEAVARDQPGAVRQLLKRRAQQGG
jgi:hypothetical protein